RGPHLRPRGGRRDRCYGCWARGCGRRWAGRWGDVGGGLGCRAWCGCRRSPTMGAQLQNDHRKGSDHDDESECGCTFGGPERCSERKPEGLPWHVIGPSLRAVARRGILSACGRKKRISGTVGGREWTVGGDDGELPRRPDAVSVENPSPPLPARGGGQGEGFER